MRKRINRRTFLTAGTAACGAAVVGGSIAAYSKYVEPSWIEVNRQSLYLPCLDPPFDNYCIVQISDIHTDLDWMDRARLEQIVGLVNDQQPDIIVITGDFISGHVNNKMLDALHPLRYLQARDGIFAVLGNHDHWGGPYQIRRLLRACGIYELNDLTYTIPRGNSRLHLIGLDDLLQDNKYIVPIWSHKKRLSQIVDKLPPTGAVILLVHEPDFADVAASVDRIDLQLSGHSHGGQVRIPFYGALDLPPLGQRYPIGLYRTRAMLHYTNRGLGMVAPRIRLNCRPEITVFTCHPAYV